MGILTTPLDPVLATSNHQIIHLLHIFQGYVRGEVHICSHSGFLEITVVYLKLKYLLNQLEGYCTLSHPNKCV
jgi:hypothetical protein